MDRLPRGVLVVGVVVFIGLASWSFSDENWAGVIVGLVLAGLCIAQLLRMSRP